MAAQMMQSIFASLRVVFTPFITSLRQSILCNPSNLTFEAVRNALGARVVLYTLVAAYADFFNFIMSGDPVLVRTTTADAIWYHDMLCWTSEILWTFPRWTSSTLPSLTTLKTIVRYRKLILLLCLADFLLLAILSLLAESSVTPSSWNDPLLGI